MQLSDLDKRAELTIWARATAQRTREGRPFATLREALAAAADALRDPDARPWIVTEDGDILSPNWIREHAREDRLH